MYNSNISSYARSLVRDSFASLVLKQPPLRLTESLFGEPSSFEVLKFVGGITVTPDQSSYPLQEVQIKFNFTLNFSIQQILDHFGELTNQLKSGLHLGPYEVMKIILKRMQIENYSYDYFVYLFIINYFNLIEIDLIINNCDLLCLMLYNAELTC